MGLCRALNLLESLFLLAGDSSFYFTRLGGLIQMMNVRSGLPWWLSHKEFACNVGDAGDEQDLLKDSMATHSSKLPGESHGQRSQAGCSP